MGGKHLSPSGKRKGVIEVLRIREKSGTLVRMEGVLAMRVQWLMEKLHAVSEVVMREGDLDIVETKCDLWVGMSLFRA